MNKITDYISKGKGVGAIIILFVCVIYSAIISLNIRSVANMVIPYIQIAADEILPLKIEKGTITAPENFKKSFPIFIDSDETQYSFVVDTTVDTLDPTKLEDGLYVTRTNFYAIDNANGKIESKKLEGDFYLEKKDYTETLKTGVKWIVICITVLFLIIFFIGLFIANLFYTFCASIAEKIAGTNLHFDGKMRLSAVCLSIMLLVSSLLSLVNISIPALIFIASVVCLQVLFLKQIA